MILCGWAFVMSELKNGIKFIDKVMSPCLKQYINHPLTTFFKNYQEYIVNSMIQKNSENEFKPITLQITNSHERNLSDTQDTKLQEYHRLLRMKKMLAQTQQKMNNRIRLFKKASEKLIKKRQNDVKIFNKLEMTKTNPFFLEKIRNRQQVRTAQAKQRRVQRLQKCQNEDPHVLAQRLMCQKLEKARCLKEQRERYKVLIEQRKKVDLQRKLQSANAVRKRRQNVKIAKEHLQQSRKEDFYRQIYAKYDKQREQFTQLQRHLNELQIQEQQALREWKRTLETPYAVQQL